MPDIRTLLAQARANGTLARIVNNPLAQFGPNNRRYIGAELLPERTVEQNQFTEDFIAYRTIMANAGTRYSPVQIKNGAKVGSFDVKLADQDMGSELTSRDYDALLAAIGRNASLDAMAQITRWADATLVTPLIEWIERARWQAIVSAAVTLTGNNEYSETVAYSNPAGHRAAIGTAWTTNTYDPYTDIFSMVNLLASKGYGVRRIITSRRVLGIMGNNNMIRTRAGNVRVNVGGALATIGGRASLAQLNASNQDEGLPAFEPYDLQYRTMTGTGRFLPDTVMVFIGSTGREEGLDLGDTGINPAETLTDTIGYVAVGRAAGQVRPGRVMHTRVIDDSKPPRIEGEAWQTSLPVIYEPEAIGVLTGI